MREGRGGDHTSREGLRFYIVMSISTVYKRSPGSEITQALIPPDTQYIGACGLYGSRSSLPWLRLGTYVIFLYIIPSVFGQPSLVPAFKKTNNLECLLSRVFASYS